MYAYLLIVMICGEFDAAYLRVDGKAYHMTKETMTDEAWKSLADVSDRIPPQYIQMKPEKECPEPI